MPELKIETTINGHDVTVQQTRGPERGAACRFGESEPGIWIDDYGIATGKAFEAFPYETDNLAWFDAACMVAGFMANNSLLFCKKCGNFYARENAVSTHFAGQKCSTCAKKDATCEDGGKHDYKCVNPSQKRNARVATKHKCNDCGSVKKSTPTG
jgi:hypothetical protein